MQSCNYNQLIDIVSAYIIDCHSRSYIPGDSENYSSQAGYVYARFQVAAISVILQNTVFLNALSMRSILNIDGIYGVTVAQFLFDHRFLGDYLLVEYTQTRGSGGIFRGAIRGIVEEWATANLGQIGLCA